LLVLAAAFMLLPAAAQANPSFYKGPLFGLAVGSDGTLVVADSAQGLVNGDNGSLVAALPGVTDIGTRPHGSFWAVGSGGGEGQAFLYRVDGGVATQVADLAAFEQANNPDGADIESNPFDVVDLGGGRALIADAGANDLLRVDKNGHIEVVAVFPNEDVSTDNIKHLAGCPNPHVDFCSLPPTIPAEAVPTSVAIGPDGAYYVGELKGFPAPTGESRIWRVDPNAKGAQCGSSPQCTVVFDSFTSVIDVLFKGNTLYVAQLDDASWAAVEIFQGNGALGGSVQACNLTTKSCQKVVSGVQILTAITFRGGNLWGTKSALIPGQADAVQLQ